MAKGKLKRASRAKRPIWKFGPMRLAGLTDKEITEFHKGIQAIRVRRTTRQPRPFHAKLR